jgi:8-oxo-dGTP diphosphatase
MTQQYFQNVATGNARVGIQAGSISGAQLTGIGAEAPAGDVTESLEHLLTALREAHRRGELDRDILAASEFEAEVARSALAAEPRAPGRAILALRKLGGLVSQLAGAGTVVASIVAQVERLGS